MFSSIKVSWLSFWIVLQFLKRSQCSFETKRLQVWIFVKFVNNDIVCYLQMFTMKSQNRRVRNI